jgi:hypothetical protein
MIDRLTLQLIVRCDNEEGAERIARKLIQHGYSLGEAVPRPPGWTPVRRTEGFNVHEHILCPDDVQCEFCNPEP